MESTSVIFNFARVNSDLAEANIASNKNNQPRKNTMDGVLIRDVGTNPCLLLLAARQSPVPRGITPVQVLVISCQLPGPSAMAANK